MSCWLFAPKISSKFFRRRKIKCRESSETRFGKVSWRSEPCSRGKRPLKVYPLLPTFRGTLRNRVVINEYKIEAVTYVRTYVRVKRGVGEIWSRGSPPRECPPQEVAMRSHQNWIVVWMRHAHEACGGWRGACERSASLKGSTKIHFRDHGYNVAFQFFLLF